MIDAPLRETVKIHKPTRRPATQEPSRTPRSGPATGSFTALRTVGQETPAPCSPQRDSQRPIRGSDLNIHQRLSAQGEAVSARDVVPAVERKAPFAPWTDLEGVLLSEVSQTEKDKYCANRF